MRPEGIFNRATAGYTSDGTDILVERSAIAAFAETIGETNPIHHDPAAARAAGHRDVVAPATFSVVLGMMADKQSEKLGQPSLLRVINADMRYILHGTEAYEYHAPIHAGDQVRITNHVVGFSDAKGGALEIAHLQVTILHPDHGPLVTARRNLIHRLPEAPQE